MHSNCLLKNNVTIPDLAFKFWSTDAMINLRGAVAISQSSVYF